MGRIEATDRGRLVGVSGPRIVPVRDVRAPGFGERAARLGWSDFEDVVLEAGVLLIRGVTGVVGFEGAMVGKPGLGLEAERRSVDGVELRESGGAFMASTETWRRMRVEEGEGLQEDVGRWI